MSVDNRYVDQMERARIAALPRPEPQAILASPEPAKEVLEVLEVLEAVDAPIAVPSLPHMWRVRPR
jgi:hypothetical protein